MARTLSASDGKACRLKTTTNTIPSSIRRTSPISSSSTLPKFSSIKKAKKKNSNRVPPFIIDEKGSSLPQFSSATFENENTIRLPDSGKELEVLKCILLREGYLQRLRSASTVGHVGGIHLADTLNLLDLLRTATLEAVEAIVVWRHAKQKGERNGNLQSVSEPEQYKWNGINYLLKLASDLEFLNKHTGLTESLGFTLHRNPFILALNLDRRAEMLQNVQSEDQIDSESTRYLDGEKYSRSISDKYSNEKSVNDAQAVIQKLQKKKITINPHENRLLNDQERILKSPSKADAVSVKSRALQLTVNAKHNFTSPPLISIVEQARYNEAERVILDEEALFGRYTRDIHNRAVPEDEAIRRFDMIKWSCNAYNVPTTLPSLHGAEDIDTNDLRSENTLISSKPLAKKRPGMLGPCSKPNWRTFNTLPPPRRRARGAQFEQVLTAEKVANVQLQVLIDTLKEEMERKAMDIAYFESCTELQDFKEGLLEFIQQSQRELQLLREEIAEKVCLCEKKVVGIQKKEELLLTFKEQQKTCKDNSHAKRIDALVPDLNQDQNRPQAAKQRQINHAEPLIQHFCATQFQKLARGMLTRARHKNTKARLTVASALIQAGVRGFLARRSVAKLYWQRTASIHIQRVARGWLARQLVRANQTQKYQRYYAIRIQKWVRGHFGRIRMAKIRELVNWRLQLALASRSIDAEELQELARACQSMVSLPGSLTQSTKTRDKPLPTILLGLVRLLILFTSDSDGEWDVSSVCWHQAAWFLRCSTGLLRRMQNVADAAAGAARAYKSPSGRFEAAGAATPTPYLRESTLGAALLDVYLKDPDFQVETFERISRGSRAAVMIFQWTKAFNAIVRLQHLVERSIMSLDPFLVIERTLSKREAQQEMKERREANFSGQMVTRRFVPLELTHARGYPFHRSRPLLLVVATDIPLKARKNILEKLQVWLPGLFVTIKRPLATASENSSFPNSILMFDFKAIKDALALGQSVILEGDLGLLDVTQRCFCNSFASVKNGLQPLPMCILVRHQRTRYRNFNEAKQGNDMKEEKQREETKCQTLDADLKVALDRTTRLRMELENDTITREMIEQAKCELGEISSISAIMIVMKAVIVLLTPESAYKASLKSDFADDMVEWHLYRQLLAQPASLRAKLQQVDVTMIPSANLVAVEQCICHSLWPDAVVARSQVTYCRLLYALAAWVESATRVARLISANGTGSLAPEITRSYPIPGLFERVIVFDDSRPDSKQSGAGQGKAAMDLLEAVLSDVQVYQTARHLERICGIKRQVNQIKERNRSVITLFHECRRVFAIAYSPRTSQRWMTVISENDIDKILMPIEGKIRTNLPPTSHAEMYLRLTRLCFFQKRQFESFSDSSEHSEPFELVLRPHASRLYRHVLQFGGFFTTITIAELSRGHVKVDAFVHGNSLQAPSTQSVMLSLIVDLENIQGRVSGAQSQNTIVPALYIPSLMLDRLHLYSITRTNMVFSECRQEIKPLLRLGFRTSEKSYGRVLFRRAIRLSVNRLEKRWIFTLIKHHEDGEFRAAFYAPRSCTRHIFRITCDCAKAILFLSKFATSSQLHHDLSETFRHSKPFLMKHQDCSEDTDDVEHEITETRLGDLFTSDHLRRCIISRFSCGLRIQENLHQKLLRNQVMRMYVQVELSYEGDTRNERYVRKATALLFRMWLPASCREQYLVVSNSKIEATVGLSWKSRIQSSGRERLEFCQNFVRCYFEWDPSIENGCVVANLPYAILNATELKKESTKKPSRHDST
ncbi:putative IQ motif, EF-hand binding protein [Plasmopara halstedii]